MKRTRAPRGGEPKAGAAEAPALAPHSGDNDDDAAEREGNKRARTTPELSFKAEGGGGVNMTDVVAIMAALREKPDWQRKVADPAIARRYALEAAQQGASPASAAVALRRLLVHAVKTMGLGQDPTLTAIDANQETTTKTKQSKTGNSLWVPFDNTLTTPPVRMENGWPLDEDEDYYQPELDQFIWRERQFTRPGEGYEYRVRERNDVHGVRYVDGAVPAELKTRLERSLDAIAAEPDKDFHPGSEGKVQDLIHPSLYPYVRGLSYEVPARGSPSAAAAATREQPTTTSTATSASRTTTTSSSLPVQTVNDDDDDGGEDDEFAIFQEVGDPAQERKYAEQARRLEALDSIYQWLPAEFDVSPEGHVTIASYINNLPRVERHAELYDAIAAVFRLFLPLFAEVVGGLEERLYGRRLQVVVKAANYVVQPGERYEGSWHVEGMKHEHICASGIYYYSTTPNLRDTCLAFRDKRSDSISDRENSENTPFNINLGKVDTPEGRCLAFTNKLQHRVKGVVNHSDEPAVRKILCFFLIDPDHRVKSSADIPEQQWDTFKPVVVRTLIEASVAAIGVVLPRELLVMILDKARWGFTKAEAYAHREALMKERKYFIDANNQLWERSFSFCEH